MNSTKAYNAKKKGRAQKCKHLNKRSSQKRRQNSHKENNARRQNTNEHLLKDTEPGEEKEKERKCTLMKYTKEKEGEEGEEEGK